MARCLKLAATIAAEQSATMQVTIADLDELRGFGWRLWDPLGVDGLAPRAEYDTYLLRLVGILRNGGSDEDGQAYLALVEADHLGQAQGASGARAALVRAVRDYLERLPPGRLKFR